MAAKPLEATVRFKPEAAIIDLKGEIDGFAEQTLNAAYAQASAENPKAIVLNFNQVNYINSTGIALIVNLLAQSRQANRRLLTYGLSGHYVEIFEVTRLSDFIGVFPDEVSALAGAAV
ncbi:MAG: anti-sigma factor antagonist [Chloroflexota bacterium]|nr:MAG: anti-sigma factor antagonist [Chloroflexota bacterium]